jgi:hypothetical protein
VSLGRLVVAAVVELWIRVGPTSPKAEVERCPGTRVHDVPRHHRGGRGGIRTHERVAPLAVFKTAAFVRSATLPAEG